MSNVRLIRKDNGQPFKSKRGQYVFEKEGVHFALSEEQMTQMKHLILELEGDSTKLNQQGDHQ